MSCFFNTSFCNRVCNCCQFYSIYTVNRHFLKTHTYNYLVYRCIGAENDGGKQSERHSAPADSGQDNPLRRQRRRREDQFRRVLRHSGQHRCSQEDGGRCLAPRKELYIYVFFTFVKQLLAVLWIQNDLFRIRIQLQILRVPDPTHVMYAYLEIIKKK